MDGYFAQDLREFNS